MNIYEEWKSYAEAERSEAEEKSFWNNYFDMETENYKRLLLEHTKVFSGKESELAAQFNMEPKVFAGFLDGINTSLKTEIKLDELTQDSDVELDIDYEKLYFNMLDAKADWLYNLTEWDDVLSVDKRHEITRSFRESKIFKKESQPGRNDPCPCGSGKKYKKCCGKDA